MKLTFLTALTMFAFAANSILNRLALAEGMMGASSYALIRLGSGAMMLVILLFLTGRLQKISDLRCSWLSVMGLCLYILGFSYAYLSLEAGFGALLLFGGVQVTMFAGAIALGARPHALEYLGSALGLAGLAILLNPFGQEVDIVGAVLMIIAAIGWGMYSLMGQRTQFPLQAAAASFVFSVPIAGLVFVFAGNEPISIMGSFYAIASGVIFSALGYYLWYMILPQLATTIAAIAQLTVPIIAMAMSALVLGEVMTVQFFIAVILVISGVLLSLFVRRKMTT